MSVGATSVARLLLQVSAWSKYFPWKQNHANAVLTPLQYISSSRTSSRCRFACSAAGGSLNKSLVVDTDMGPDDIAAIALLASNHIPIHLVTTVHGVCGDRLAAELARRIVNALWPHCVKVVPGAPRPRADDALALEPWMLDRRMQLADFNMRARLPADESIEHHPSADDAADAILRVLSDSEESTTILALGPLSNVARAVEKDPAEFCRKVDGIVFAGESSSSCGRNICFNARLDLAALETVLRAQVPIVFVGSRSRMQSDDFYARLGAYEVVDSLPAYLISEMSALRPSCIVDDPTAASYILRPDIFDCELVEVVCDAVGHRFCRVDGSEFSWQNAARTTVLEAKTSRSDEFVQLLRSALTKRG